MKRRSFFQTIAAVAMTHPALNWVGAIEQVAMEEKHWPTFTMWVNTNKDVGCDPVKIHWIPCYEDTDPVWEV